MEKHLSDSICIMLGRPPCRGPNVKEFGSRTARMSNTIIETLMKLCADLHKEYVTQMVDAVRLRNKLSQQSLMLKAIVAYFLLMMSISFDYNPLGDAYNHAFTFDDYRDMFVVDEFLHCHMLDIISLAKSLPDPVMRYINNALYDSRETLTIKGCKLTVQ